MLLSTVVLRPYWPQRLDDPQDAVDRVEAATYVSEGLDDDALARLTPPCVRTK